jgi:hypothetical protein
VVSGGCAQRQPVSFALGQSFAEPVGQSVIDSVGHRIDECLGYLINLGDGGQLESRSESRELSGARHQAEGQQSLAPDGQRPRVGRAG